MHVYQNGMDNICLKHRFFFFNYYFLMHLGFANLSKPVRKSKYFGLLLGDGDVCLLCTMTTTGFLLSPPSSSGNDRNRRIGAIQAGINFPILFTHVYCCIDSIFADMSFLLDKRTDILLDSPRQKDCLPLCDQLKFHSSTLLSRGSTAQNYRQAQNENS